MTTRVIQVGFDIFFYGRKGRSQQEQPCGWLFAANEFEALEEGWAEVARMAKHGFKAVRIETVERVAHVDMAEVN